MPILCEALFESSTNRASMYTCWASTSIWAMAFPHASRMGEGAVIMTEFDSGKSTAILDTFHTCPNSPFHISLNLAATSAALAWLRRKSLVSMTGLATATPFVLTEADVAAAFVAACEETAPPAGAAAAWRGFAARAGVAQKMHAAAIPARNLTDRPPGNTVSMRMAHSFWF